LSDLSVYWEPLGFSHKHSGIYQSAKSLFVGLKELGQPVEVVGAKSFVFDSEIVPWGGAFHKFISPLRANAILREKILKKSKKDNKKVIFHGHANFNIPVFSHKISEVKYVLTVHDLIPLLAPKSVSLRFYVQFLWGLKRAIDRADTIIAVSCWTKRCLEERFPQARKKIFLLSHGLDPLAFQGNKNNQFKAKGRINLLFVSRYEYYKRFELLGKILAQDSRFFLSVVCDHRGLGYLLKKEKKFIDSKRLKVFVDIDTYCLRNLYKKCDVYIHPSLYEGFCLPIRDALWEQVPVVYCQGSAVGELVRGDCGLGVSPDFGAKVWGESIRRALDIDFNKIPPLNFLSHKEAAKNLLSVYNN
jgi:glycosyltransferase involved in cell wall biosynthesis